MKQKTYYEKRELSCIDKLKEIIKDLPYYVEDFFIGIESNSSSLTRLNYGYDLRVFFNFLTEKVFRNKSKDSISLFDIDQLTSNDLEYFLSYLSHYYIDGKEEKCSASGKARKLSTLRAFYKFFFNKNALTANTATKVQMPKIHEKEIIRLDSNDKVDEIGDLLYTVETGVGLSEHQKAFHKNTKIRDVAIITLFLGTGIRISELVGLDVENIDLVSNCFVVTRKGGNQTVLYFNNQVKNALSDYMSTRVNNCEISSDEHALFLSSQKKRISTRQVQELVKKYSKVATPLKKITPHKLRSTFGTNLYRQTHDIYAVADCLGHKDVNTTRKHYAAITEDVRKKAGYELTINPNDK